MNESANQWMLFGMDMRQSGQQWSAAWRDFLFAPGSPLRLRLDEPVALHTGNLTHFYQGGVPVQDRAVGEVTCSARLLPDELVLTRTLTLPVAAEADLYAVIEMEVAAGSPFSDADTVYGWAESERGDATLVIALAIASKSAVGRWLRAQDDELSSASESAARMPPDPEALEVWALVDASLVTLRGFGETLREAAYRKRLLRCAMSVGAAMVLLLVTAGLFALHQKLVLERLENVQAAVMVESREASAQRERLVDANEKISAAGSVLEQYPNPHLEIARLSELLGDGVFVAHFSATGRQLRVRGRADDAASVMQTLAETEAFGSVTAPQAITSVGNSGVEQFYLDIELLDAASGDGE